MLAFEEIRDDMFQWMNIFLQAMILKSTFVMIFIHNNIIGTRKKLPNIGILWL
jgi:hypothetical protein